MFLRREDASFRSSIPFDAIPDRWPIVDDDSGSDSGVADKDDGLSSAIVSQDVEDGGK
ncbi:hypothetical protein PC129_g5298 [Phytophthora cactorum]|nr:hypothetical protein Pcac1_g17236 [Phytophthora cactorum]KAG2832181.1 hypothetical protein PC112_g6993 [Phytophthora cactorum]KAG2833660.1 hypothetical protein PC111_g6141 [Phytophthora cactorum]KAG2918883.1 hypothetical protein PC114_g6667 [Phytophthora cactorum]KAG2931540.1 hypothetical protein PC115_g6051 [Phytophthora cactorum]